MGKKDLIKKSICCEAILHHKEGVQCENEARFQCVVIKKRSFKSRILCKEHKDKLVGKFAKIVTVHIYKLDDTKRA